jgi:hypothetical protein
MTFTVGRHEKNKLIAIDPTHRGINKAVSQVARGCFDEFQVFRP